MSNIGRPSLFTEELADQICTMLVDGESLRAICRREEMPSASSVFKWLRENEEFSKQYARAKEEQADTYADEIIAIADECDDKDNVAVSKAKLRVDARKWAASKLKPKKYGDSTNLKHSGPDGEPITAINVNVIPQPKSDDTA